MMIPEKRFLNQIQQVLARLMQPLWLLDTEGTVLLPEENRSKINLPEFMEPGMPVAFEGKTFLMIGITPELILQVVADHFDLTPQEILSQKRNKEIVYPRQIAMYLCRNMTAIPLQVIGKVLGGRDHTTILHGIEKITKDLQNNQSLQNTIDILKKKIHP